ncbi:MAG: cell division protein FtsZ [Parcubacteria group bacterium CG1_02_36_42]|nr:MAG: cell division protein FtsZ [Parcubacteria group bacterium CG1_02_36_42]
MKKKSNKYNLAKIKVVGIGGAGNNTVSRMFDYFPRQVDLIAINTDVQDLNYTKAKKKIHIGKNLTKGLGTGMNPDLGRQAAEENRSEITESLKGADMVFITAGCGGGTGTGASPIVAEIAKELGILTVAVVTKPFGFEGTQRAQIAHEGIIKLREQVHTLITIPNDRIFSLINKDTPLIKAFEAIDEVLKNSVLGITELIVAPGIVNVDFADVKAVMNEGGSAIIGVGVANGPERAAKAANLAVNSPLLEASIDGAKGVLFSISGHRDLKMNEINEVAKLISENVDQSAKIIFGAYYDRKLNKGQLKVTLIATGFNGSLPDFFSQKTNSVIASEAKQSQEESLDQEIVFEETKKKEKTKEKKSEEVWDIPTFLRKKRR